MTPDGEPALRGTVERGDARGRRLGFPTANVAVEDAVRSHLPRGVHAGRARVGGAEYGAVVNIGRRPTFGAAGVAVEVHLLDFAGDLYGQELEVWLAAKIRDERRFATPADLAAQIRADVTRARQLLATGVRPDEDD